MRWIAVATGLLLAGAALAQGDEIELELEPAPAPSPSPTPAASPATEAPPAARFLPRGPASTKRVILAVRTPDRNIPYRLALPRGYGPRPGPLVVLLDPHATTHRYVAAVESPELAGWAMVAPLLDMAEVEAGAWPALLTEVLKDVEERFGIRGAPAVVAGFGAAATLAYGVGATPGLFHAVLADGGIVMGTPATQAGLRAAGVQRVALLFGKEDITARMDARIRDAASIEAAKLDFKMFGHDGHAVIAPAADYGKALSWLQRFHVDSR